LKELELEIEGIIGYSDGEYAASYADGALSHEQALLIAHVADTAAQQSCLPEMKVATIGLGWADALGDCPPGVTPAIQNCPNMTTICGLAKNVADYLERLKENDVFYVEVDSDGIGVHTPMAEPMADSISDMVLQILPEPLKKSDRWITSRRSEADTGSEAIGPDFFVANFTKANFFYDCVKRIPTVSLVLEVGRKPMLQSFLSTSLESLTPRFTTTPYRGDPLLHFFNMLGQLYTNNLNLNICKIYPQLSTPVQASHALPWIHWSNSTQSEVNQTQKLVLMYTQL